VRVGGRDGSRVPGWRSLADHEGVCHVVGVARAAALRGCEPDVALALVAVGSGDVHWALAFAAAARCEVAESAEPRRRTVVSVSGSLIGSCEGDCGQHRVQCCLVLHKKGGETTDLTYAQALDEALLRLDRRADRTT
jgi:hypothetical protein